MTNDTISQLRHAYLSGDTTVEEVMQRTLAEIKEKDETINAFLEVFETYALNAAKEADERFKTDGENAPRLTGIPVALKNNIMMEGVITTAGSKMLEQYQATYDATVVAKLKAEGAIIVGTTNLDEFAMGSSTEHSAFGPTSNPLAPERVPGGSSGGSAAAVAMGAVPVAIGTDTGGSIRQPASFCGLVGFKPTYGAVSRYGLIAMGSSFDQAGPLTRTVEDAKIIHDVMQGLDPKDGTSLAEGTYGDVPTKDTYTFGVPRSFLKEGVDEDVLEVFETHIETLKAADHEVVDIELPLFEKGLAAYYISIPAEVSSNLARFDGIRYGHQSEGQTLLDVYKNTRGEALGAEVKRRILLGTYVLSAGYYDAYYGKAETVRELMRDELREVFETVDMVLTPTAPTPAFEKGAHQDPVAMYAQDVFTVPVNLTGVPAISLPSGTVDRDGVALPVGVQYIAPHGGDERLFDAGKKIYDTSLS